MSGQPTHPPNVARVSLPLPYSWRVSGGSARAAVTA